MRALADKVKYRVRKKKQTIRRKESYREKKANERGGKILS